MLNDASGRRFPARRRQEMRDLLVERPVTCVDHPVQLTTTPARGQLEAHVEERGDPTPSLERQAIEMTPLYPRDERCVDSTPSGHVHLSPAAFEAYSSDRPADLLIVHLLSVTDGAWRELRAPRVTEG